VGYLWMNLSWNTWEPGGYWFMKKTWSWKSRVRLSLKENFKFEHFRLNLQVILAISGS
jgi:hypothetical protein